MSAPGGSITPAVGSRSPFIPTSRYVKTSGVARISAAERPVRRRRLLDAAWRQLAQSSFLELTVEDVCTEADLSKGSFYGYFRSKRELLYALVDDDLARLLDAVDSAAQGKPAMERLRLFAETALAAGDDRAHAQLAADAWAAASEDAELASRLRAGVAERRALVRGWIELGQADGSLRPLSFPPNALASVLLALVDGLVLHHRLDRAGFQWPNVRLAVGLLLNGVDASLPVDGVAARWTAASAP